MANKREALEIKITNAIKAEKSILDAYYVTVKVNKIGGLFSSKCEIRLTGRLAKEQEVAKAVDIATELSEGIPVVNELRVKAN